MIQDSPVQEKVRVKLVDYRTFIISINADVNPFAASPKRGYNNIKMKNGLYFNYKGEKIPTEEFTKNVQAYMLIEISKTVQYMIKYWRDHVNGYFNRRAYGIQFNKPKCNARNLRKDLHKHKSRRPSIGRMNTGKLRNALRYTIPTPMGCKFFVIKCMHNGADYVNILIHGAGKHPGAYVPSLDRRIRRGTWCGITNKYWIRWWKVFVRELYKQEDLLNQRIMKHMVSKGIYSMNDVSYQRPSQVMYIRRQEERKMSDLELVKYDLPRIDKKLGGYEMLAEKGVNPYKGKDIKI